MRHVGRAAPLRPAPRASVGAVAGPLAPSEGGMDEIPRHDPTDLSGLARPCRGPRTGPARATWTYFFVTNAGGTKIAEVAEQIFYTGVPALGYDYEYRVANITPTQVPIFGFQVFVGNQAGLAPQALFPTGPIPGYLGYSLNFGPIPNASSTFLTGEGQTYTPISWGFSELLNAGPTGYQLIWATAALPLPYFRWTEFDLFSPNPPVSGGGAVDPFAGPGGLGVDLTGTGSFTDSPFPGPTVPINTSQDLSDPYAGMGFTPLGPALVPEPSSLVLLVSGSILIGGAGWRGWSRRRSATRKDRA